MAKIEVVEVEADGVVVVEVDIPTAIGGTITVSPEVEGEAILQDVLEALSAGKQPLAVVLTALAALSIGSNKLPRFTGSSAADLLDFDIDGTLAANSDTRIPSQKAIVTYVAARVAALLDGAPGALDTLNELAAALGDDANFASTVVSALAGKQPLDADLTALAGVGTQSFGRNLLTLLNAGDLRGQTSGVVEITDDHTLALSGRGNEVRSTAGTLKTLLIPPAASVAMTVNDEIPISQYGDGALDILPMPGVTLKSPANARRVGGKYARAMLKKVATDEWHLSGVLMPRDERLAALLADLGVTGYGILVDAGDGASYESASLKLLDLSGGGNHFWRGTDGTGLTLPTFNGTEDGASAADFFSNDSTDLFRLVGANPSFIADAHKSSSAEWSAIVAYKPGSVAACGIFGTQGVSGGRGICSLLTSDLKLTVRVGKGDGTQALNYTSTAAASASIPSVIGMSVDADGGAGGSHINISGAVETFNGNYASPNSGDPSFALELFATGNASNRAAAGSRFWWGLFLPNKLSVAAMSNIVNAGLGRFA